MQDKGTVRLGLWFWADEPVWVQARIAVEQAAQEHRVELVFVDEDPQRALRDGTGAFLEDLQALTLDVLVCSFLPQDVLSMVLGTGLPVIHLGEAEMKHARLWSPGGLYEAALTAGLYLAGRLPPQALVLAIGGGQPHVHSGSDRLEGLRDGLRRVPGSTVYQIPTPWEPEQARPEVCAAFEALSRVPDAVFALSDPLALLARDVGLATGAVDRQVPVVGLNGDPLALAALIRGELSATVDLNPEDLGHRAVQLALDIVAGTATRAFVARPRLITPENVGEEAVRKLIALADLPSRLVGVNRDLERGRLSRLEAAMELGRRMTRLVSVRELVGEIPEAVRFTYGYDLARLYRWSGTTLRDLWGEGEPVVPRSDEPLGAALGGRAVFVADARRSGVFSPDPQCPEVRARAVLPVQAGRELLGVLDLQGLQPARHARQELESLQWLADQLGSALRAAQMRQDLRPVAEGRFSVPAGGLPAVSSASSPRSSWVGSVLIADADPQMRTLYRVLLARAMPGRNVHTVLDGAEALAALSRELPGLVILESSLAKLDGFGVLAALRERSRTLPVWMVSGQPLRPEDTELLDSPHTLWHSKAVLAPHEVAGRLTYLEGRAVLAPAASGLVKRAVATLHQGFSGPIQRDALARDLGVSANHLSALFRQEMGLTPWAYLHRVRINQAKLLLRRTGQGVNAVTQAVGFEDPSYFARIFRRLVGQSPQAFRRGAERLEVLSAWCGESSGPEE
ncbi:helix-turn-helix domain-containing protein [Deinococcus sp. Arct2-2]|uniref:helix-turn-helix domain-containing protein n=1 Tax=Deinococcus sp. Arct2-2 TaxID=2568653 RepID=UPI0010A59B42|nr:helix-turn-helix domain-containing protein [Deinococcus sp. Arct2-2]THF66752.1 helix-turn-helix domain-containing protein [Deinococcus sp. Arct2-2]